MLFSGLLLNQGGGSGLSWGWLNRYSFWHAAFEGLMVNEVNGLALTESKHGLNIDVPGAVILQTLGLDALGYWRDVARLWAMIGGVLGLSFLWLLLFVRETR